MSTRGHPRLALPHGEIELDRDDVALLRDAAAALAGRSTIARDLSLLLDRALTDDRPIVLRRPELRMLARLAGSHGLEHVAASLSEAA